MPAQLPQGITRFKDDDDGFLAWLRPTDLLVTL